jgi:hypothetical protein
MEINIEEILNKKHLLLIGGSKTERESIVTRIIENSNYETFRFPKEMKLFDEYLLHVRKVKLFDPWYDVKGKHGNDQVLDFHRDWISDNHSLIIIEEIHMMEERWRLELIRCYLEEVENHKKGEKFIHLIISQDEESDLVKKLSEVIHVENLRNRTKRQVIESCLKIIDISN